MRWRVEPGGWQAKNVAVASGVGLIIHTAFGETISVEVTAYTNTPLAVWKVTSSPGCNLSMLRNGLVWLTR